MDWRLKGYLHLKPPIGVPKYWMQSSYSGKTHKAVVYRIKYSFYRFERWLDVRSGYAKERDFQELCRRQKQWLRDQVDIIEARKALECGQESKAMKLLGLSVTG